MSTIKDVAEKAGVSIATVSRVLNRSGQVRPELEARVLAAVKELGYRQDRVARTFRTRTSRVIGLIISDIQNPFFTAAVRAVEDVANQQEYALFLANTDEDLEKERAYVDLMLSERVAGVVISPTRETANPARKLIEAGVPVVSLDRRMQDLEVDTVVIDNATAAQQLVEHMIGDGHTRIGAVLGTSESSTGRERREGYERALAGAGLPLRPELIREGVPKEETGYAAVMNLLALPDPLTGLFFGNNLLTVGGLQALHELKMAVPQDISVVAFDQLPWMSIISPTLTVAAQPIYELGRSAAELLLARIADRTRPVQEVVLDATLQIGESCAVRHLAEPVGAALPA